MSREYEFFSYVGAGPRACPSMTSLVISGRHGGLPLRPSSRTWGAVESEDEIAGKEDIA